MNPHLSCGDEIIHKAETSHSQQLLADRLAGVELATRRRRLIDRERIAA